MISFLSKNNNSTRRTPKYHIAQELVLPDYITQGIDGLAEDGPTYLMSMTIEGCAIKELPRQV